MSDQGLSKNPERLRENIKEMSESELLDQLLKIKNYLLDENQLMAFLTLETLINTRWKGV